MVHSLIELDKAVVHVISLISFCDCGFHSVCPPMDKNKRLIELVKDREALQVQSMGSQRVRHD